MLLARVAIFVASWHSSYNRGMPWSQRTERARLCANPSICRLNGAAPYRPPRSAPLPAARGMGCLALFINVATAKAYRSNEESTSL